MTETPFEFALHGSLTLHLRGDAVSPCLAELHQSGVTLRHVRVRGRTARCTVSLRSFGTVYSVCRKYGVRFHIEARHGAPFWGRRLWQRKLFAVGAVAFVCVIYFMSSVIWRVDISGPEDEEGITQLRAAAVDSGVYVGQLKSRLPEPAVLADKILKEATDFVWVGVTTTGSVTTIQAVPKIAGTKTVNETPHNIIATRPAVIRTVAATRGRVLVKPNQYVRPGQVIISGILSDGEKPVPASGKVLAEVWYTSQVSVPLQVNSQGLTGERVSRDYLYIGPLRLRVWGWKEPHFQAYYERDQGTSWRIGDFLLPVQWQHVNLFEATPSAEQKSIADAKQTALQAAINDVRTQAGGDCKVLGQSVLHERVQHGTLYETVLTRVEQDIGAPAAIPYNVQPKSQGQASTAGT